MLKSKSHEGWDFERAKRSLPAWMDVNDKFNDYPNSLRNDGVATYFAELASELKANIRHSGGGINEYPIREGPHNNIPGIRSFPVGSVAARRADS